MREIRRKGSRPPQRPDNMKRFEIGWIKNHFIVNLQIKCHPIVLTGMVTGRNMFLLKIPISRAETQGGREQPKD
jgi:hypothetical protein